MRHPAEVHSKCNVRQPRLLFSLSINVEWCSKRLPPDLGNITLIIGLHTLNGRGDGVLRTVYLIA